MLEFFTLIFVVISIIGTLFSIVGILRELHKEPEKIDWTIKEGGESNVLSDK